ncbi:Putative NADPH-quinone reductase (modulator of drug activity B) [Parapedobacter composti]|uniref:Putative NADPH-quinone reductase (Modulator of drug activity B) n=1 Tax=Parapedobacter composti TaxID=623281 RepID=A0A1I1KV05_9SPHI|nr:NAD(P)H-dependent oxidoreductase [Parapedobacter composti]SFC64082.1 Putative NADPH-quinone reductase (modulator of drug activity B) [Parapedobacter composti]
MRKILIINGHPDPESFNRAIARTYMEVASRRGAATEYLALGDLDFDPNLRYGYRKRSLLEPDLLQAIEKIKWSDHMVWIHPLWWWSYPAVMKGFIDRVFLPGITYTVNERNELSGMLQGRSGRIICTSDMTEASYASDYDNTSFTQLQKGTLETCGVAPVKTTFIGPVIESDEGQRSAWLTEVAAIAAEEACPSTAPAMCHE